MNSFFYSIEENSKISNSLTKLFALQDKNITEQKKKYFIEEFAQSGFPSKAILSAIESMFYSDMNSIKISTIISSIRNFAQTKKEEIIIGYCQLKNGIILECKYFFSENGKNMICAKIANIIDGQYVPMNLFFSIDDVVFLEEISSDKKILKICRDENNLRDILRYDSRYQDLKVQNGLLDKAVKDAQEGLYLAHH